MKPIDKINYEELEKHLTFLADVDKDTYMHPEWDEMSVKDSIKAVYNLIGLKNIYQDSPHHNQTLFKHMERAIINVQNLCFDHPHLFTPESKYLQMYETPEFSECFAKLTLAAIFHDIAKPDVEFFNEKKGYHQTPGHEFKSKELFEQIVTNSAPNSILRKYPEVAELVALHGASMHNTPTDVILAEHSNTFPVELMILEQADLEAQDPFYQYEKKMSKLALDAKELSSEAKYYIIPFADYDPSDMLKVCADIIEKAVELKELEKEEMEQNEMDQNDKDIDELNKEHEEYDNSDGLSY